MKLNPNELIKDIKSYEDLYAITTFGRVYSYEKIRKRIFKAKFLKQKLNRGYPCVNPCKHGKIKTFKIHRLVANEFIPNPHNLSQVNHKDGNKKNNNIHNLEWCTRIENEKHAVNNGLKYHGNSSKYFGVGYHRTTKCSKKWISSIRVDGSRKYLGYFKTELEAASAYNNFIIKYNLNRPLNIIER